VKHFIFTTVIHNFSQWTAWANRALNANAGLIFLSSFNLKVCLVRFVCNQMPLILRDFKSYFCGSQSASQYSNLVQQLFCTAYTFFLLRASPLFYINKTKYCYIVLDILDVLCNFGANLEGALRGKNETKTTDLRVRHVYTFLAYKSSAQWNMAKSIHPLFRRIEFENIDNAQCSI